MTKIRAPSTNFWSTTLSGSIDDSVTTITLNSTSGLNAPGYLVIDREDSSGNATPNNREVIYYTGISGNDLTGVTRAADGSTARAHSDGALVEATMTVGMFNGLASEQIIETATISTANIGTVKSDTINELTAGAGVLVDSVLLKDGGATLTGALSLATINESVSGNGVNIDGMIVRDGGLGDRCKVTSSSAATVATATDLVMTWDTEEFDTNAMHNTATNNSRITFKRSGIYHVIAHLAWPSNNTGDRQTYIRKNGTTALAAQTIPAISGRGTDVQASFVGEFDTNDYVEAIGWQTSGGDLAVQTDSFFAAYYIGEKA